ncbi:MAG: LacI family DNA-binding transcriptional regulator [Tepidisphaeraceae bacterium]
MRGPVTAEKLAKKLGLSRATVSIVLRGDAERRKISGKTTQRVLDAAREFNYVPNQAARSLRRQRTDIIGVILPDFRLDWAERVMDGMLDVLGHTPYSPFVAIHRFRPELFRKEVLSALQRRDDAIICYPLPEMNDVFDQVRAIGIPLVFIGDRPLDYTHASWVVWDAGAAASAAVRHLVSVGRKRIGFLGMDYPMKMSQARYKAYRAVLKEANLPINPEWISMPSSETAYQEIVESGLDKIFAGAGPKPDALFVLNDGTALPALESLRRRGLRVPEDVAVISMGDVPQAGLRAIGLSTMREPLQEMGRGAAEEALKLIANSSHPIQRVLSCDELHARHTTIGERWDTASG